MTKDSMRHVVVTASDAKYGDFLLQHWLRSLRENISLSNIDIAVLDYGLNETQREQLLSSAVHLHASIPNGNITNIRYRDLAEFLKGRRYDQVLAVDGGDVIFQSDISPLFDADKDSFRGVLEERDIPFHDILLPQSDLAREDYSRVFDFLEGKPTINGGVLFGPAFKFRNIWPAFRELCHSFDIFGTDQLLINYLLYSNGFVALDPKYNFAIIAMKSRFFVRNGAFHDASGELIPIVHNAGMQSWSRCIAKFGYGPNRNRRKLFIPLFLRSLFYVLTVYRWLRRALTRHMRTRARA